MIFVNYNLSCLCPETLHTSTVHSIAISLLALICQVQCKGQASKTDIDSRHSITIVPFSFSILFITIYFDYRFGFCSTNRILTQISVTQWHKYMRNRVYTVHLYMNTSLNNSHQVPIRICTTKSIFTFCQKKDKRYKTNKH